jgi:hypothetical protein
VLREMIVTVAIVRNLIVLLPSHYYGLIGLLFRLEDDETDALQNADINRASESKEYSLRDL